MAKTNVSRSKSKGRPVTAKFLRNLDFSAALTEEQVSRCETAFNDAGYGRRVALLCLKFSKTELVTKFKDGPDGPDKFLSMLDSVERSIQKTKEQLDMLERTHARMLCVGQTIADLKPGA